MKKIAKEEIANVTGDSATMAMPATAKKDRRYKMFDVDSEIFRRFQTGRIKFERWSKYLDLNNEDQKVIYNYALKNSGDIIVLRDSTTGALRAIRRRSADGL